MTKTSVKKDLFLSIYIGLITGVMTFFIFGCEWLEADTDMVWDFKKALLALALCILTSSLSGIGFFFLLTKKLKKIQAPQKPVFYNGKLPLKLLLIWPIIFACFLPCFLAYYPGILAYDMEGQFYQLVNHAYNNHHPLAHTLLVELFYRMGDSVFHSKTFGIALLSLFQMLILSGSFTFMILTMYRFRKKKSTLVVLTLFSALYPLNAYLSITMTKDILFAAGFLLTFCSLLPLILYEDNSFRVNKYYLTSLIGYLFIMLFRSNGKFCLLLFMGMEFLFILFRKGKRKLQTMLLLCTLLGFILGMASLTALDKATNATEVDKREMFSLPMQQIARMVHYHKEELPEETLTQIETLIWPSTLYLYRPDTARFVKNDFISWEIVHYPVKYLKLYLDLFKKYPSDYVNAFLGLYSGFLDPFDTTHTTVNDVGEGVPVGLHYIQTVSYGERFEVYNTPVVPLFHKLYEAYANNDGYLVIPVLSLLFVPGVALWVLFYAIGILIYQGKGSLFLPITMVLAYFLTFFLGPTVQLRYVYPIMICIPPILVLLSLGCKAKEK